MVSIKRTQRYFIATVLTFIAVTASDSAYVMESSETMEALGPGMLRCAIVLDDEMYSRNGLNTGFNYELLNQFARTCRRDTRIVTSRKGENYLDSLRQGKVDIVVMHSDTELDNDGILVSMNTGSNSVWAVREGNLNGIRKVNSWISHYEMTYEYMQMKNRYFSSYGQVRPGTRLECISPYDSIIKKYAKQLGWDWRMLAAVIYQESRFSINSHSGRGASGLMQVMPSTAKYYGIDDLIDPEENIKAGTMHLARLQQMFRNEGMDTDEKIRFTLAAYNAGEGRIADCRNLAQTRGFDTNIWEEVAKVIPEMRDDSILQEPSVKLGKFQGYETISYVDNIMEIYESFCSIKTGR